VAGFPSDETSCKDRTVRLRPNFTDAHLNLADLLAQEGKNAEARSHAQIALELSPANERARNLLKKLKP
jgi:Flp pilus assembly protein TadD